MSSELIASGKPNDRNVAAVAELRTSGATGAKPPRRRCAKSRTYGYKLAAFVIAGALAGLAGFLVGVKDGAVNPELLSWHESGAVLLMIILGGIGSLRGAVLGAVAFTLLKELFQSEALLGPVAGHWQLTLGLTIIAFVALLPKGLIGLKQRLGLGGGASHG